MSEIRGYCRNEINFSLLSRKSKFTRRIIMNKATSKITHKKLLEHCLTKTGAYIDHPFGMDSDIIKVKNRIFAQLFFSEQYTNDHGKRRPGNK